MCYRSAITTTFLALAVLFTVCGVQAGPVTFGVTYEDYSADTLQAHVYVSSIGWQPSDSYYSAHVVFIFDTLFLTYEDMSFKYDQSGLNVLNNDDVEDGIFNWAWAGINLITEPGEFFSVKFTYNNGYDFSSRNVWITFCSTKVDKQWTVYYYPEVPELLTPTNGTVTGDPVVDFSWTETAGPHGTYTLSVSPDQVAWNVLVTDHPGTSFQSGPITPGGYYWQVVAVDGLDRPGGGQANPFWFEIMGPPDIPVLLTPEDSVTIGEKRPQFRWSHTAGSGGEYTLQYATDPSFVDNVTTLGMIMDTTYIPAVGLADTTWYWHVQAKNTYGVSSAYQATPFWFLIDSSPLDVDGDDSNARPGRFALRQNYPNPFNPTTTIEFYTARAGTATLTIFNQLGQRVKMVDFGRMSIGEHTYVWNGTDDDNQPVASGVYFYKLETDDSWQSRKMILMK